MLSEKNFFRTFAASCGSYLLGKARVHVERDVLPRLSRWNINFAKVTTITDGATKRLRCKHDVLATTPVALPSVRHSLYIPAGVGIPSLLILMVEAMRRPMFPG